MLREPAQPSPAQQKRKGPRPLCILPPSHLKRRLYCLGEMTVGSLPAPPRMPLFFTHVSTCLSQVYCRQQGQRKQKVCTLLSPTCLITRLQRA